MLKKLAVVLSLSWCMVVWRHTWCLMSYFRISVLPWACHVAKWVCTGVSCVCIELNCELQMLQTSSLCRQTGGGRGCQNRKCLRKVAIYLHIICSFARDWSMAIYGMNFLAFFRIICEIKCTKRKTISSPHLSQFCNNYTWWILGKNTNFLPQFTPRTCSE